MWLSPATALALQHKPAKTKKKFWPAISDGPDIAVHDIAMATFERPGDIQDILSRQLKPLNWRSNIGCAPKTRKRFVYDNVDF